MVKPNGTPFSVDPRGPFWSVWPMTGHSSFTRRSFLKTLGAAAAVAPLVTRGLMAQSPNGVVRHASFGAGGQAWSDLNELAGCKALQLVAVAEVDLNRTSGLKRKFPEVKIYQDWRQLLDKEGKNLDSVNVSTPDHMHAIMAISAMELGKHVYCEKPLAHDLHEVDHFRREIGRTGLSSYRRASGIVERCTIRSNRNR